jgi:transcription elongation factor GreA
MKTNGKVQIGSEVLLRCLNSGEIITVKLARASEPKELKLLDSQISPSSPLGQALQGRQCGEFITVKAPTGEIVWEIIKIR